MDKYQEGYEEVLLKMKPRLNNRNALIQKHGDYTDSISKIREHIIQCREDLEKYYGDQSERHYMGLCDDGVQLLKQLIEADPEIKMFALRPIHGELAHLSSIRSTRWPLQHTMLVGNIHDSGKIVSIYMDPTSEQFFDVVPGVPNYYIAPWYPWWFYPDSRNPVVGIENRTLQNIAEFFVYDVYGCISDIRGFFNRLYR